MTSPIVITDNTKRVYSITDHYRQALNGKMINNNPSFIGNFFAGWYIGGGDPAYGQAVISTVQRITYATDNTTASVRGPLFQVRTTATSIGNTTDIWVMGGSNTSAYNSNITSVERITFANDMSLPAIRAIASFSVGLNNTSSGNATDGWTCSSSNSNMRRLTYANDTAGLVNRALASVSSERASIFGNTTERRSLAGGSLVRRYTYATDLDAPVAIAGTSIGVYSAPVSGNNTAIWVIGGPAGTGATAVPSTNIRRYSYANDTVIVETTGFISGISRAATTANTTNCWVGGGYINQYGSTTSFRYDFATGGSVAVANLAARTVWNTGM